MRKGIRFAGAAIGKKRGGRAEGAAKAEAKQDRMADNTLSRKQKILARYPNMTGNEIMKTALLYALVLAAVMWLCFRNFLFCMAGVLFVPVLLRRKDREEGRKKQMRMQLQFRKTMEMMYSSAAAGASAEKCIRDTLADMRRTPEDYTELLPAFEEAACRLDSNVSFAEAMEAFASQCSSSDIRNFVRILCAAVRSGGSLPDIIRRMSDAVRMRVEVNEDIETMLTEKKSELRLMKIFPLCILLYLSLVSSDYMDVLFSSAVGHGIMIGALGLYILAVFLAEKILDIRV